MNHQNTTCWGVDWGGDYALQEGRGTGSMAWHHPASGWRMACSTSIVDLIQAGRAGCACPITMKESMQVANSLLCTKLSLPFLTDR